MENNKNKERKNEMCYSSEGKYIVDGKEISIDYDNIETIPIELLKKLEEANMNQLDAFYIRKRMHDLTNSMFKATSMLESLIDDVPRIADERVHKIVNGKFDKIQRSLNSIELKQQESDLHLIEKINYVGNKTIFGWMKNRFERKPLSTIIYSAISGVVTMILLMKIFGINSFMDFIHLLENWIPWIK